MSEDDVVGSKSLSFGDREVICLIKKNRRARRISLRITSHNQVVLNVPSRGSISEAKKFLVSRIDWICEKTAGMPVQVELSEFLERKPLVFLDHHPRNIIFEFSESRKKIIHQITSDYIEVTLPTDQNKESSTLSFMLQLARIYLPSRLERCAQQVGVTYKKVRVGNQKSRWGSCSSQRVISLNWRILLLDYAIGEYVLYHELAHLKHMNHSSKYWKLLEEWVPRAKAVDRELSSAGRELMLLARA
jgi:predicted metal-dependent hydrolase